MTGLFIYNASIYALLYYINLKILFSEIKETIFSRQPNSRTLYTCSLSLSTSCTQKNLSQLLSPPPPFRIRTQKVTRLLCYSCYISVYRNKWHEDIKGAMSLLTFTISIRQLAVKFVSCLWGSHSIIQITF